MSGEPYSKARQLARGSRRYRRKIASPKQWQAIISAKAGPCRVCCDPKHNGSKFGRIQFHHLISRARGGDDVPENIVPLCQDCHGLVTQGRPAIVKLLAKSLTNEERAYVEDHRG